MFDLVILGLGAAGVALLFRALPWPKPWLKVKPWACNTCLGFHGAWVALLLRGEVPASFWQLVLQYFVVGAVATPIVAYIHPPEIELPLP